jgi:ABC-type transport system involved in multi-copper enzyme maturation permease subunit
MITSFPAGVATVAGQEFRLRIRAGRWRWLLAAWFATLAGFTVLVRLALGASRPDDATRAGVGGDEPPFGTPMYGSLMLLVLGLGMLVVPALTAQSVNGDRERGTLATLQVTRLSAAQLATGKLAAAWGTSLVFLALTLPLVVWSVAEGGVPFGRLAVTMLVVALLLGVVCAVAQGLSALLVRSTTSAVLSYLVVFALSIGTLIAFGLASALTTETVTRTVPPPPAPFTPPGGQESYTYTTTQSRTDRVWWLLAPNPFVVLADAAPALPRRIDPITRQPEPTGFDPLGEIGRGVREQRAGPQQPQIYSSDAPLPELPRGRAVWPIGLAVNLLLGAAALAITVRRLRTPLRALPRGVRVA